jgi:DNA-binding transcriptional ArsR family regulator
MSRKRTEQYEAWARIVKGLAHPTRLLLVAELLRWKERCVCDLTTAVGADMSTVSRHLVLLRNAGIVTDEKRGQMVLYHLCTKQVKPFLRFVECCLRRT